MWAVVSDAPRKQMEAVRERTCGNHLTANTVSYTFQGVKGFVTFETNSLGRCAVTLLDFQ